MKPFRLTLLFLLLGSCLLGLAVSCGEGRSASSDDPYRARAQEVPPFSGIRVVALLDTQGELSSLWAQPAADLDTNSVLSRVPGVHWSVQSNLLVTPLPSAGLETPSSLHWVPPPRKLWSSSSVPTLLGGGSPTAGVQAWGSALWLPWKIRDLSRPLQIQVLAPRSAQPPNVIAAQGTSCGQGCWRYSHILEALDAPLRLGASQPSLVLLGGHGTEPPSPSETADLKTQAAALRDFYTNHWGAVPGSEGWSGVALRNTSGKTQGLEHEGGAVMWVAEQDWGTATLGLVAHEMAHTWNARWLMPAAHSPWSPWDFSPKVNKDMWFFEGFTEGFSLLALAEAFPKGTLPRERLVNLWNAHLLDLSRRAGSGTPLEELCQSDSFACYHVGAAMVLDLALHIRATGQTTKASSEATWSLFKLLGAQLGRSRSLPWAQCWTVSTQEAQWDTGRCGGLWDTKTLENVWEKLLPGTGSALLNEWLQKGVPTWERYWGERGLLLGCRDPKASPEKPLTNCQNPQWPLAAP